jgi:hypothetical protein
VLCNARL